MRVRTWTTVGALALIAGEVWAILYLTPLATLTISVDEAYETVNFGSVAALATFGAVAAAALAVTLSLRRRYTGNPGQVAIIVGIVSTTFAVVDVFVGFGYISLYDADPGNFRHDTNWVMTVNLWGSLLLPGGLIALAVKYFRRTWNTGARADQQPDLVR